MIKLKKILEGGKLFGSSAQRISTDEMLKVFDKLNNQVGSEFKNFKLSKFLKSKSDHGDIDIVLSDNQNVKDIILNTLGNDVLNYSKNGNIYSILYKSDEIGKNVHVDFIYSTGDDFYPQYEYLSYNDFSGVLGVLSRRINFNYGTKGFFKIYKDKKGQNHYILITKNLKEGLKILGYGDIIEKYDDIKDLDDIVDFISYTPFFDSKYYSGENFNRSDKKRLRSSRPTASYVREKLINLNKSRKIDDDDYFLKKLYPNYYKNLQSEINKIESYVLPKSKYNGKWLMQNFPEIKPGPIIARVLKFWNDKYGDSLDDVSEKELFDITQNFLN